MEIITRSFSHRAYPSIKTSEVDSITFKIERPCTCSSLLRLYPIFVESVDRINQGSNVNIILRRARKCFVNLLETLPLKERGPPRGLEHIECLTHADRRNKLIDGGCIHRLIMLIVLYTSVRGANHLHIAPFRGRSKTSGLLFGLYLRLQVDAFINVVTPSVVVP